MANLRASSRSVLERCAIELEAEVAVEETGADDVDVMDDAWSIPAASEAVDAADADVAGSVPAPATTPALAVVVPLAIVPRAICRAAASLDPNPPSRAEALLEAS
jgi:hypothetical protein